MKDKISKIVGGLSSRNKNYRKVFSDNEGEYVLADLYRFCGMDRPSYVEGSPDRTAYNEGMKRVALRIKSIMNQSSSDVDRLVSSYKESINRDPFKQ